MSERVLGCVYIEEALSLQTSLTSRCVAVLVIIPHANHHRDFLSRNGGSSNAYTSSEHTNYYFSLSNPSALPQALDIFAQFFIAPLLNSSAVTREVSAVDSEHLNNLQSDGWRRRQLLRSLSEPKSRYNGFYTGNLESLCHEGVIQALQDFYTQYYYAVRSYLPPLIPHRSRDRGLYRTRAASIRLGERSQCRRQ